MTHCLLELGADPNDVGILSMRKCHSLDIFTLLAEFGLDFKKGGIS